MEFKFPTADEFLTMCNNNRQQKCCFSVTPDIKIMRDRVIQELKMTEIEHDITTVALKIHKTMLDTGTFSKRKIRFYMSEMSKHVECHVLIMNIISEVADNNGYVAVFYEIDRCNKKNPVCYLVPASEFVEGHRYEDIKQY